jgi:GNAT superfamily N-acetyltransferase
VSAHGAREPADEARSPYRGVARPLIRLATATDADAIAKLLRVVFDAHRWNYPPEAWRSTAPEPLEVVTRLEEGPVWVACVGDRLVGTLSSIVKPAELQLRSLAVDPAARRNGVGARLLRAAHDEACARGMHSISLETAEFLAAASVRAARLRDPRDRRSPRTTDAAADEGRRDAVAELIESARPSPPLPGATSARESSPSAAKDRDVHGECHDSNHDGINGSTPAGDPCLRPFHVASTSSSRRGAGCDPSAPCRR